MSLKILKFGWTQFATKCPFIVCIIKIIKLNQFVNGNCKNFVQFRSAQLDLV